MPSLVSGAEETGARTHVVRIPGTAMGDADGLNLSSRLTLDYGTFGWVALSPAAFARLQSSGVPYEEQTAPYVLRLGGQRFDPLEHPPDWPAGWDAVRTEGPALHLVQFVGPTRARWVGDLEALGLKIVQYIHPCTYIVWGEPSDRAEAVHAEGVRWTGPFVPACRVLPQWRNLRGEPGKVKVVLYRGAVTDAAIDALEALGARIGRRSVLNRTFEVVGLTLSGHMFQAAAQVPGVYSIQPVPTDGGLRGEMSDQVNVNNVDGSNLAFPGYLSWLLGAGLSGSGVTIANVDGGVQNNHPDLVNRITFCIGTTCGGAASSTHGTHTAGIMAADGGSGTLDTYGFLRGLGVAPGATLVEQVFSPFYVFSGGMLLLMTDSYNNGASLSGNSWGPAGTPRGYDNDTMQVDIGVRDADPNASGDQMLTYVLAIMNGGGGTSSQGTPDEAKNIFTIGSTKMQTYSGAQILQINDLSANSAHGPALDGRKIPHMVAPGCSVDSSVTGSSHGILCGTSMACPHVAGAVALFIEYYRQLPTYVSDPSPALVKAAFLPVARDLAGHRDADNGVLGHPFDSKQGWGRMDLEAVVDPPPGVRYFDHPVVFDNTGEEWTMELSPFDAAEPMRLMLVWTDAPGHGLGGSTPAWNNDLDLVVEVGTDTYRGNVFGPDGWSQPGGGADGKNNTEGVFLGPASPVNVTVRVVAANINSDGVPNSGDGTDQDFALVCYNCTTGPSFSLTVEPDEISLCAPDDAVYTIGVGQIGGLTDPVTLNVTSAPTGANLTFNPNPVTPPGDGTMTVTNTGAVLPGPYEITLEGATAATTRSASVGLMIYGDVPAAPALTSPTDSATGVSLRPTFEWTAPLFPAEYEFELATDAGFGNVIAAASGLMEENFSPSALLDTTRRYFWRVRAINACGGSGDSATFTFYTTPRSAVFLVDDDDDDPDVRSYYTDALDALDQAYELWDTNSSDNEPDAATLSSHTHVLWFTGDAAGGASGPGATGEAALASFLDAGGCLFISSQGYYSGRGLTAFMADYLGVWSAGGDVGHTSVAGAGSVFGGLGPFALSYPFVNDSDRLTPDATAELAFSGDMGDAAVSKEGSTYWTTLWGFPWEAVDSVADRVELMRTVLDWCDALYMTDCNDNDAPDEEDLLLGTSEDCNLNTIPDECDIAGETSLDCNVNGIPDECEDFDCDDGDACTNDACDTVPGCVHTPVDCDDGEECTEDSCDAATGCANTYVRILFADIAPPFARETTGSQPNLADVVCALDGFASGPDWATACPDGDLWRTDDNACGGDGRIDLNDILALLAAFSGTPPCPNPCP